MVIPLGVQKKDGRYLGPVRMSSSSVLSLLCLLDPRYHELGWLLSPSLKILGLTCSLDSHYLIPLGMPREDDHFLGLAKLLSPSTLDQTCLSYLYYLELEYLLISYLNFLEHHQSSMTDFYISNQDLGISKDFFYHQNHWINGQARTSCEGDVKKKLST
jgi:hypothetical protein